MNIIVHYPKTAADIHELQKRAARVHAEAIISHIQKLSCPREQKLRLLEAVKSRYIEAGKVGQEVS